jgi:hypothetical protein
LRFSFTNVRTWLVGLEARYRSWFSSNPRRAATISFLTAFFALLFLWASLLAVSATFLVNAAGSLSEIADNPGDQKISEDLFRALERDAHRIRRESRRVERLTRFPLADTVLPSVPVVGPRYEAGRQSIKLAVALGDAAAPATTILRNAYAAFETTGITWGDDGSESTWLNAVDERRDLIPQIAENVRRAQRLYGMVDMRVLPGPIERRLGQLDDVMPLADEALYFADNYEPFFHAAGGNGTIRYLFLFQNPAELRPAGGFPGTFGIFEFQSGQLVGYEMFDSHDITRDYMANRTTKLEQPWAFEMFAPQDGFILHDATWYADFPKSARLMLEMYAETSWPPVNGIIAVQPEAVSEMVRVTGPVEVLVDDQLRTVTADNVYDEVERYRRLRFEGLREGELGDHKDILIDIGEAIMDQFKRSGGGDVVEAARLLLDSADRRNLQIFIDQPEVQAFFDEHGWSGRLIPDEEMPTLAILYANMVLEKASMAMEPSYDLYLDPQTDGGYLATLEMTLRHTGRHDQDHRYFGFQRWFIQVVLPDGASWRDSDIDLAPDPEAPDGGAYVIDLFPEQTKQVWVEFDLPEFDQVTLRRQPGQVPPEIHVHKDGCESVWGGYLTRDLIIDLDSPCPSIRDVDDEEPRLLMLSRLNDIFSG